MTPDLRQLRYFVAVAEESSYTRAAERLTISQQSLSQQISLLERMLAVRLFDRDSRGTSLTAVGALFLPEARAVLDRADEAMDVVARAARGEVGSLRLAFLATTTNYLLPPVVRAVGRRLPGLDVATEETTIAPLVEGLRKGRYDVAFTRPPLVEGLETRTLVSEPVCAVLPEGHPLAQRAELTLGELAGEHWVLTPRSSWEPWHRAFDDSFRAAGFTPDVVRRDASVQSLRTGGGRCRGDAAGTVGEQSAPDRCGVRTPDGGVRPHRDGVAVRQRLPRLAQTARCGHRDGRGHGLHPVRLTAGPPSHHRARRQQSPHRRPTPGAPTSLARPVR
ncbi:LysR family transcriptional regulator [Streptomyces sp. NPDC008141]|uniref:LysR family transcriptional regulator n=1 Tax=Streptomyces sp. NPDC008141 TaxID=3364815 RepID=UPI0036E0CAB3